MYIAIGEKDRERLYFYPYMPVDWVITKQACGDESIVSLFFPLSQYINLYIYISYTQQLVAGQQLIINS